jgi:hypothetical protein
MGFTSINDSQARAQRPRSPEEQAERTYINPPDMINHLLLVWPVRYEPVTETKYPRLDGKPSDAVYVDVVDLSVAGEDGYPGKVMRQAKWTQGRLIRDTKGACGVGREEPMLVQMTKSGDAYELIEQAHNPGSVQMAEWWMNAHPQFEPGQDAPARATPPPPAPVPAGPIRSTPPYPESYPMPAPAAPAAAPSGLWPPVSSPPVTHTSEQNAVLARLRAQAEAANPYTQKQSGPAGPPLPPPPPPAPPMAGYPDDSEPPF